MLHYSDCNGRPAYNQMILSPGRRREAAFASSVMPGSIGHPGSCHARSSIKNVKDKPRSGSSVLSCPARSGIQRPVMPDPDRASRVFGFSSVVWKDAGRHPSAPLPSASLPSASLRTGRTGRTGRAGCRSSPTGSWCLCVGVARVARPSFLIPRENKDSGFLLSQE